MLLPTSLRQILCFLTAGACALSAPSHLAAQGRLEPANGCYFGVSLDTSNDTITALNTRLGFPAADYVVFVNLPLGQGDLAHLDDFYNQVKPTGGLLMITAEPNGGLEAIDQASCIQLANKCASYEQGGVNCVIRFAHEMNGNWYAWGQRPNLYKEKFRALATEVHARTVNTAMLWAPNEGLGYPFGTGTYSAQPHSADFQALDTNGDGTLDMNDDPYSPYYPGDDAVDWVGMTIYHFGSYPVGDNVLPANRSFADRINGTMGGPAAALPDFYALFCGDSVHHKPMAVPETAGFYNPSRGGSSEYDIKHAWWLQAFDITGDRSDALDLRSHFPKLKIINWFDFRKAEAEAGGSIVDWRISQDVTRTSFVNYIRQRIGNGPYFLGANEYAAGLPSYSVRSDALPVVVPLQGPVATSVTVQASAACDLVVDLLDANYQWHGGTRQSLAAGVRQVNLSVPLQGTLADGQAYRWSVFLTPTNASYQQALAWANPATTVARALQPWVKVVAAPAAAQPGKSFHALVSYVTNRPGTIVLNVLSNSSQWQGGSTATVPVGEGEVDLVIPLSGQATAGNYRLDTFLSDTASNWQGAWAWAPTGSVSVVNSITSDSIQAMPLDPVTLAGQPVRLAVSSTASSARDLHVDMFGPNAPNNWIDGFQNGIASGNNAKNLPVRADNATAGSYRLSPFLCPAGQTWQQATAWGTDSTAVVVSAGYMNWVLAHWGFILPNDLVKPTDDADGDGVSNYNEFLANTDPRNASSHP